MQLLHNSFKGMIFDLDGTLVSSTLNFKALRNAIGCPSHRDILTYIEQLPSGQAAIAHQIIQAAEHEDAQQARRLNGTFALLDFLLMQQIPMAIVTRNCRQAAMIKIEKNDLPIELIYTREDGPAKPNPSCLLAIADQWQIPPEKIAYVGDHLYDVEAANRARMQSILLTFDQIKPYQHQANYVFKDLRQVLNAIPSISLCA